MMLPLYLSEEGDFTMRHGSSPLPVGGTAKRVFDIAFSICAILTFALPLIGIAIALKIFSRGPVIFAHERIGHDGKKFRCLKFRTMVIDAEERLEALLASDAEAAAEFAETRKLVNDPRIVPHVGTTLRKLSLDELPQLFNVLKGDMSLVGPRPVTRAEIEAHYGYRHPYMQARPGITGPWQVSGRNDLRYEDRVALDAGYVSRWSFTGDLAIILHTAVVLCRDRNGH
jgi:lipopolysaccharide/colanic/teichoic acid biosynthesis glycosyltransferase